MNNNDIFNILILDNIIKGDYEATEAEKMIAMVVKSMITNKKEEVIYDENVGVYVHKTKSDIKHFTKKGGN